ncbi:MAG: amidohydrolase [Liquorilactobacillus ghanensis]|uniref:amidohydrolase n=1 Tax=Liquorilactobacillus ghanensis TaxID=399370 RepID=UPI0039E91909
MSQLESIKILKSKSILNATLDHFFAGALVIKDNRIIDIVSENIPQQYQNTNNEVIDFGDRTILPGFIESHAHIFLSALVAAKQIILITGHSESECVADLVKKAQAVPNNLPGDWLVGKGWYLPHWMPCRMPTKNSLDQVFPDRPTVVIADDLHTLWLNSAALNRLLPKAAPERYEQDVHLDESGDPDGVIGEQTAMGFLHEIFNYSDQKRAEILQPYLTKLTQYGITSICDLALLPAKTAAGMDDQIYPAAYKNLALQNHLPVRVNLYPYFGRGVAEIKQLRQKFTTEQIKVAGGKLFFDDVTSSYTAWMKSNYEQKEIRGTPNIAPNLMKNLIFLAAENQIPLRIHTIGDQAIHQAILDFQAATAKFGSLKSGHHCLEHLETIDPNDISLLKKNDLIASIQPSHPLLDYQTVSQYVGRRAARMWPFATFFQRNIPVAFGTDSPVVTDIRPMQNIYFAMTRQTLNGDPPGGWHPKEKLSLFQALQGQTINAAKACSLEEQTGSLQVGKSADICVLERNIENLVADQLKNIQVDATLLAGNWTFR